MVATRMEKVYEPCAELGLDAIGREFGEQGGMLDCIKSTRYVYRDGPDLISAIEGFHPLLGKKKEHSKVELPGLNLN